MTAPAANLERNRVHRDVEARCRDAIEKANIPLTVTMVAKTARVTTVQARRALTQLGADGDVVELYDELRDGTAYTLPGRVA